VSADEVSQRLYEAARAVCDAHRLLPQPSFGSANRAPLGVPEAKMTALAQAVRAWEDQLVRGLLGAPELSPVESPRSPPPKPSPPKPSRTRRAKVVEVSRRLLEAHPDDESEPTRPIRRE
jgi:hypothetical protein